MERDSRQAVCVIKQAYRQQNWLREPDLDQIRHMKSDSLWVQPLLHKASNCADRATPKLASQWTQPMTAQG
jgi:hypothetical protein